MAVIEGNPTWDLTRWFPDPNGPEIEAAVEASIAQAQALMEETASLKPGADLDRLADILKDWGEFRDHIRRVGAFLHCTTAADTGQTKAQMLESRLEKAGSSSSKASSQFTQWLGTHDLEAVLQSSPAARDHEYFLSRTHFAAQHQMSLEEEALAADLAPSASSGWSRLFGNFSSQIQVDVPGFDEKLSMSRVRTLAYEADRSVRQNAYKAELEAWKANEIPIAAALNGIKGWTLTVGERRGWKSPLDEALYRSGIDGKILDAMLEAAQDAFPQIRRYFHLKAKALGIDKCAFYDIFAPLRVEGGGGWNYPASQKFVQDQFEGFAPQMGQLAAQAYAENWIDVDPRVGKRDGAFCSGPGEGRSLILMNFKPAYNSLSTLAHELGHAYHNYCLRDRTALQRGTPMTLAETASTFCETICRRAAIKESGPKAGIEILEASLQGAAQITVDITSRFLFESRMIEARKNADVGAEELCRIMRQAQVETYGDGLTDELHPYMWAAKPHYYGSNFYNFPYMFGLLFSLGLYAVYEEEGAKFVDRYDRLLSRCGMASPKDLAAEFGIDITTRGFWDASLRTIRDDIDAFEAALA